jgi:hypothetical protein
VQNVDAPPAGPSGLNRLGESLLASDVGFKGHTLAALFYCHRDRLLCRSDRPIDGQDFGAFASETERRRAPVADPLARALAGTDDDGDLAFQTHFEPPLSP